MLKVWVTHYNGAHPHMALGPGVPDLPAGAVLRVDEKSRHHLAATVDRGKKRASVVCPRLLTKLTMLTSEDKCARKILPTPPPHTALQRDTTRRWVYGNATIGRRRLLPCSADYLIASFFPGAAAFLTSLSSRTPLSNLASHAGSSSSTGSVKLR